MYFYVCLFSVRVYTWNETVNDWAQKGQDLLGEAAADEFGYSVSLSYYGDSLAVGARYNDIFPLLSPNSGQVRVFYWDTYSQLWVQRGLDIDGSAQNVQLGTSVSLSSDGLVVAAGAPVTGTLHYGFVLVYAWSGSAWVQRGSTITGYGGNNMNLGTAVHLTPDGTTLTIGTKGYSLYSTFGGNVRVYRWISGAWTQVGQDVYSYDFYDSLGFSISAASSGMVWATGIPNHDWAANSRADNRGSVQVYQMGTAGTWVPMGLPVYGEAEGDNMGWSISMSEDGTRFVASSIYNDAGNAGTDNRGRTRVYQFVDVCPAGYFSASGSPPCTPCPVGSSSTLRLSSTTCSVCPAGTYASSPTEGASECTLCPWGSYSTAVGASVSSTCVQCDSGLYSSPSRYHSIIRHAYIQ